jgi:cell division transport system ATP-binding protein
MIRFEHVSVAFESQQILNDVNIEIGDGEFVSLIGESGVGKTTLLRLIYFDLLPDSGTVSVGDYTSSTIRRRDIPAVRRKLGIVFQDYKLLDDRSVYDNIAIALHATGVKRQEIGRRVLRVLADVGLSHKRNNMPDELSGGEQQRVVFARALANEPSILLADEPTGNLDANTSMEILQLMQSINAKGTAIVLASHNTDIVKKSGSRTLRISDCRIVSA